MSGLSVSDVPVIDDDGPLRSDGEPETGAAAVNARADALRQLAERLLAARVGAGNAVVEVTIDATTQTEQITERIVDPDSRIAISTEVTESSATSNDSRGGDVTVASNLPENDVPGAAGSASNENSESRTLTNYELSQTERQLIRAPGEIRRMTVAVRVNEVTGADESGNPSSATRS